MNAEAQLDTYKQLDQMPEANLSPREPNKPPQIDIMDQIDNLERELELKQAQDRATMIDQSMKNGLGASLFGLSQVENKPTAVSMYSKMKGKNQKKQKTQLSPRSKKLQKDKIEQQVLLQAIETAYR